MTLPASLVSEADAVAGQLGISRSGFMRLALRKTIDAERPRTTQDVRDLAERILYLRKQAVSVDPELRESARVELAKIRAALSEG
jgi:metal-responsive CopG/Arc/MetJ family transcriptional regulator